jgi:hypothetical protein
VVKPDHGPRLTEREYEQAVVRLHDGSQSGGVVRVDERIRRRELDLAIDRRLGTLFPADRRDQLWAVQQGIEKARLRLATSWLVSFLKPRRLHARASRIARFVVDEYAKVLTAEELEAFFGQDEVRDPTLPLDRE